MLRTERLLLRPLGMADLDDFVELHDDPQVVRFIRRLGRRQAQERLRDVEREWDQRGHGLFAVLERTSGDFIGRVGLKRWRQFDETEIGWVLRAAAWGHGYATEAARACLDWGFSALTDPYLTAMIERENSRSARVAHRLNFAPLRNDVLLDTEVVVYALHRDDWSPSQQRR
ncbi:MAG: GNAT family N-acetyltransferase [Actinomycetota bacterium]|nr:GNAT family N-acetyltransferase [Actinomycetota bacterium]